MKFIGMFQGYKIYLSNKKYKKYAAKVNDRFVHFGDKRYQHYRDKMGYYKNLDHNDKKRRDRYYSRHNKDYGKGTADYFSKHVLW